MEKTIDLKFIDPVLIFGIADNYIKLIESEIPIDIIARGQEIKIKGEKEKVTWVYNIFNEMIETLNGKGTFSKGDVDIFSSE